MAAGGIRFLSDGALGSQDPHTEVAKWEGGWCNGGIQKLVGLEGSSSCFGWFLMLSSRFAHVKG